MFSEEQDSCGEVCVTAQEGKSVLSSDDRVIISGMSVLFSEEGQRLMVCLGETGRRRSERPSHRLLFSLGGHVLMKCILNPITSSESLLFLALNN